MTILSMAEMFDTLALKIECNILMNNFDYFRLDDVLSNNVHSLILSYLFSATIESFLDSKVFFYKQLVSRIQSHPS
jgi:hypothetical protein